MPDIALGNISPISMITDPATGLRTKYRVDHIMQTTTFMHVPPDRDLFGVLRDVSNMWANESDSPPAWVDCTEDPELQSILCKHFSCGPRPEDWENVMVGDVPSLTPIADGLPNVQVNTEAGGKDA